MELSNGILRLDFDQATGNLCQITDVANGRQYLGNPRGNRLVKLVAPTAQHSSRPVYSHESGAPAMARRGDALEIAFPQLLTNGEPTGISAKVVVRLPAGSDQAFFAIEVRNDGPDLVHEVHFPWVGGWTGMAGKGGDRIVVGYGFEFDPHSFPLGHCHTFGRHHQRKYLHAQLAEAAALPFLDISGGACGLSYCNPSAAPRTGGLVIENLSPDYKQVCLSWAWVFQPFVKPGQTWRSPEVALGAHRGDWHVSADRFRKLIEPWWTAPPTPARIKRSIGLFNVQFTGFNGEFYHDFSEIPTIVRDTMRYGVNDLCLWDVIAQVYLRPDTGGFWEAPPERLEKLRRGLDAARQLGCNTSTLVNFRLITARNRLWAELAPEAQRSIYGQPLPDSWAISINHGAYQNPIIEEGGVSLCQSSPRFHDFALQLVEQTMDLGFTSLFIDQATDWKTCFADNHGHASPDDTVEPAHRWMAEAARRVRARNADAYLMGEIAGVHNTRLLDLWWDWGMRGVRPEILRYLLPESVQVWCIDENERDVIAKAFAMGCLLSLMTRELGGLLSDEPELAAQVARLAQLKQETADFIVDARFLDKRGLTVEGGDAFVFDSPAGLAVTLANSEPAERPLKVTLDPEVVGRRTAGGGRLHVEGAAPVEVAAARIGHRLVLEAKLPPYGAGVWCLGEARPRRGGLPPGARGTLDADAR
jgi:hypothetical protein